MKWLTVVSISDPVKERNEFERSLIRDEFVARKIGRGRGKRRFSGDIGEYPRSSRGRYARRGHYVQDEDDEMGYGKSRYKGNGRENFPRTYYRREECDYRNRDGVIHTLNKLILESFESLYGSDHSNAHVCSIIDTPNDAFATTGLISPNPRRPSLPIIEKKDEVKKSSSWSKEGKREREMSLLILPQPERITMPAAILPRPKKVGVNTNMGSGGSVTNDAASKEADPVNDVDFNEDTIHSVGSVSGPIMNLISQANVSEFSVGDSTSGSARTPAIGVAEAPSSRPMDATQLLFQLVNLLRSDDKALHGFRSILNSLNPTVSANLKTAPPNPFKDVTMPDSVDTEPPTPSTVEDLVVDISSKFGIGATEETSVLGQVSEIGVVGSHSNGKHQVDPVIETEDSTPAGSEAVACLKGGMKPALDRENSESKVKLYKLKSKYSKHMRDVPMQANDDSIVNPFSSHIPQFGGTTFSQDYSATNAAVASICGAVVNDDLTREELWYAVPDNLDSDSFEGESSAWERVHTLQDLKKATPPRYSTGKLYKPPPFYSIKKCPPKLVHSPGSGSTAAYNQTFQLVDATEDLGIVSRPKARHSTPFGKPIDHTFLHKSPATPCGSIDRAREKPWSAIDSSTSESS